MYKTLYCGQNRALSVCKTPVSGNRVICHGGVTFWNSLRKVVKIRNCIADRVNGAKRDQTPIVKPLTMVRHSDTTAPERTYDMKKIASKKDGHSCSKNAGNKEMLPSRNCHHVDKTPEKFFCLPNFARQSTFNKRYSPNIHSDSSEFFYVDIKNFKPKNSGSVLFNFFFQNHSYVGIRSYT